MKLNKERLLLFVLVLVQFTHIMDFMIMMPLAKTLQDVLSISPLQFSYLISVYTFSAGSFGFAGVFFLDKFDRRPALLITYLGFIAGTFACALSGDYISLLISRAITGAFGGLQASLVLAIVSDAIPIQRRGKAIGFVMSAFSAAAVFGVPFGLYLSTVFTWNAPFLFVGLFAILIEVAALFYTPSMKSHIREKTTSLFEPVKIIFTDKNMLKALLFTFLLICSQFSVIPFIADYMLSNIHFTEMQLILMYTTGGGLTVFAMPVFGSLSDSFGKPRIFTIFGTLVIIPIFLVTNMVNVSTAMALVITSVFFVIVSGRMVPATTMITAVVKPEHRGSFMSMRTSIQQFSSSIAAFMAGNLVTKNAAGIIVHYEWAGYLAIILSILSVVIGRMLKMVEK